MVPSRDSIEDESSDDDDPSDEREADRRARLPLSTL